MSDYGIKISKAGAEVTSNDPRDLLLSSKYPMLKYHDIQTSSFTFTPGDNTAYADISHSLGYVPAFIPYLQDYSDTSKLMFMMGPPPTDFGVAPWAYADSSKIRVGLTLIGFTHGGYDNRDTLLNWPFMWNTFDNDDSHFSVGRTDHDFDGAYIFGNVTIPQGSTIHSAIISSYVFDKGSSSSDTKCKIYGIAEDNTSASGNPMGRTRTSANTSENVSLPAEGQFSNHDVKTQLQEIVNRGGWASGNNAGFLFLNNGSPDNAWWQDNGDDSHLVVTYGPNVTVDFKVIIFKDKIA